MGPNTDASYDLGSASLRWKDLYLSGTISQGGYLDPTHDNLAYNGDFEAGTIGWQALGGGAVGGTVITTNRYSGQKSLQVTGSNNIETIDYIPVDPTRDVLELEGWFKEITTGSPTPGILYFGYIAYDSSKVAITTAPCGSYCYFAAAAYNVPNDGNWHKFNATTTGEGTGYPNFPVGTKFVRILGLINYNASSNEVTLVDHITLKRLNYGPLFVGNNYSSTNLLDQNQVSKYIQQAEMLYTLNHQQRVM